MPVSINRKQLMVELAASEPLLKAEAEALLRQQFFEPAVDTMLLEFLEHPVTRELKGGIHSDNISDTLDAPFNVPAVRKDGREVDDTAPPNLYAFIGFEADTDPTEAIEPFLKEGSSAGPKLKYTGMDKDKLRFRFQVSAPDFAAIQEETQLPWSPGISWAKRIEVGIPGIGFFLNAFGKHGSRSGGGIQVDRQLRSGRFKPTKYLSKIFADFLRRASSGRDANPVL